MSRPVKIIKQIMVPPEEAVDTSSPGTHPAMEIDKDSEDTNIIVKNPCNENKLKYQLPSDSKPDSQLLLKGILIGPGGCVSITEPLKETSEECKVIEVSTDSTEIINTKPFRNSEEETRLLKKRRRTDTGNFKCPHCKKSFVRNGSFYSHLRSKACIGDQRQRIIQIPKRSSRMYCSFLGCEKSFVKLELLEFHEKVEHRVKENDKQTSMSDGNSIRKCPIEECSELVKTPAQLRNHLIYDHDINIQLEKLSFKTEWEFQKWKLNVEKESACKYKIISIKRYRRLTIRLYNCCKIQQGDSGSNRMCPSKIEVSHDPNRDVAVLFYKTHLGHGQKDVVVLSRSFIDTLAGLLRQGITVDKILEKIDKSEISCKNCQNIQLVSKEHILVVARDLNIPIISNEPSPLVFHLAANNNSIDKNQSPLLSNEQEIDNSIVISEDDETDTDNIIKEEKNKSRGVDCASEHNIQERVQMKIRELSHLINRKDFSSEKCQEVEKCVDLALSVIKNKTKVILMK